MHLHSLYSSFLVCSCEFDSISTTHQIPQVPHPSTFQQSPSYLAPSLYQNPPWCGGRLLITIHKQGGGSGGRELHVAPKDHLEMSPVFVQLYSNYYCVSTLWEGLVLHEHVVMVTVLPFIPWLGFPTMSPNFGRITRSLPPPTLQHFPSLVGVIEGCFQDNTLHLLVNSPKSWTMLIKQSP